MKKFVATFFIFLGLTCSFVFGQENATSFGSLLQQMKPQNTELAYDSVLYSSKDFTLLVAFYRQKIEYPEWIGKLFLQNHENDHFREITIDTLSHEGGEPRIESFFTENIDQDKPSEFFILVSWPVRHATVSGTLYDTYIYDHIDSKNYLSPLKEINEKFEGGCDCSWDDSRTNEVTIKSKESIYYRLEELGLLSN